MVSGSVLCALAFYKEEDWDGKILCVLNSVHFSMHTLCRCIFARVCVCEVLKCWTLQTLV